MLVNLKNLFGKLNQTSRLALEAAAGLCVSRTHYDIELEHFLMKLLETKDTDFDLIARSFGIDRNRLTSELARTLDGFKAGSARTPMIGPDLVKALIAAWAHGSIDHGAPQIRTGFVVTALLADDQLSKVLKESSHELQKIDAQRLRSDWSAIVQGSVEDERVDAPAEPMSVGKLTGGPRVFLSYRRDDSTLYAETLFESLIAKVPDIRVFRDSDTLQPGMVFSEAIEETVATCDILIAVIGKKWRGGSSQAGTYRIDLPGDWVRLEVATALQQKKLVIPCLVGGAKMPDKETLPPDIAGLASRHAIQISEKDFRRDAGELIEQLKNWRRTS